MNFFRRFADKTPNKSKSNNDKVKTAVVLHLYYTDEWANIEKYLSRIDVPFDLHVNIPHAVKNKVIIDRVSGSHMNTYVTSYENRGRDVLPFLRTIQCGDLDVYDYVLKIHSKRSLHRVDGNDWLKELLGELIPESGVSSIINTLSGDGAGVIGPRRHLVSGTKYMGENRLLLESIILSQLENNKSATDKILNRYTFFAGTMFWFKGGSMDILKDDDFMSKKFATEDGQVDGTYAHALERFFGTPLHIIEKRTMYSIEDNRIRLVKYNETGIEDYKFVG